MLAGITIGDSMEVFVFILLGDMLACAVIGFLLSLIKIKWLQIILLIIVPLPIIVCMHWGYIYYIGGEKNNTTLGWFILFSYVYVPFSYISMLGAFGVAKKVNRERRS